jgi:hypothetical protein
MFKSLKPKKHKRADLTRAFTFVEVAVALVLTAVFFIPTVGAIDNVSLGFSKIRRNYYAGAYAKNILETRVLTDSDDFIARLVIETDGESSETSSEALTAAYSPPVVTGEPIVAEYPPETREISGIKITERKNRKPPLKVVVDVYNLSSEFISRIVYLR